MFLSSELKWTDISAEALCRTKVLSVLYRSKLLFDFLINFLGGGGVVKFMVYFVY